MPRFMDGDTMNTVADHNNLTDRIKNFFHCNIVKARDRFVIFFTFCFTL